MSVNCVICGRKKDKRGESEVGSCTAIMATPEGKWRRGCLWLLLCTCEIHIDSKRAEGWRAYLCVQYYDLHSVFVGCFSNSDVGEGTNKRAQREWRGKREVLIECPLRSHQMWLKGIKDSFEGGWERLRTVLTSIQIPSKSLHITLIRPCAVRCTNSRWSYHKAAMYHSCLAEVCNVFHNT